MKKKSFGFIVAGVIVGGIVEYVWKPIKKGVEKCKTLYVEGKEELKDDEEESSESEEEKDNKPTEEKK